MTRIDTRSMVAWHSQWICLALTWLFTSACASTEWEASAKRKVLQAQLESIGRAQDLDIAQVLVAIEPALTATEQPQLEKVQIALRGALPPHMAQNFDSLWAAIAARVGTIDDDPASARLRIRTAIVDLLTTADEDNRLYWRAKSVALGNTPPASYPTTAIPPLDPKAARDALMSKYILRIQGYHEANYGDLFRTTAKVGFQLDSAVVIASALATAFTPASTKTALAAAATIFGGVRLAASRNVLNEKSFSTVLNAMITQRTTALATLMSGMKQPVSGYGVDEALVDLATYFNVGGIDKALAQIEKSTAEAQRKAEGELRDARAETGGTFEATGRRAKDKLTAVLSFASGDRPGALVITEVVAEGKRLTKDEMPALQNNEKGATITFLPNAVPAEGQLLKISGTTANTGSYKGTLEWP